jgi:enoyl-CoA hydratase/carnithine racemase
MRPASSSAKLSANFVKLGITPGALMLLQLRLA